MVVLVLVALALAVVVGLIWAATLGAYYAIAALLTFIVVLLLGRPYATRGRPPL